MDVEWNTPASAATAGCGVGIEEYSHLSRRNSASARVVSTQFKTMQTTTTTTQTNVAAAAPAPAAAPPRDGAEVRPGEGAAAGAGIDRTEQQTLAPPASHGRLDNLLGSLSPRERRFIGRLLTMDGGGRAKADQAKARDQAPAATPAQGASEGDQSDNWDAEGFELPSVLQHTTSTANNDPEPSGSEHRALQTGLQYAAGRAGHAAQRHMPVNKWTTVLWTPARRGYTLTARCSRQCWLLPLPSMR